MFVAFDNHEWLHKLGEISNANVRSFAVEVVEGDSSTGARISSCRDMIAEEGVGQAISSLVKRAEVLI